jgi:hypothetical protein
MAPDLADLSDVLRERYGCHTAILYGSRAIGDPKPTSDFDIAGFAATASVERIAGKWRTSYVDAFIYPESRLESPDQDLLSLCSGLVLFERDGAGQRLLDQLQQLQLKGPAALSENEAIVRRRWAWKMLERAETEDAEGNFRRAWLLTALLEDYFALRNMWYQGPKKSLAYLRSEASDVYNAFEIALRPGASLGAVRNAVVLTVGECGGPLNDELT